MAENKGLQSAVTNSIAYVNALAGLRQEMKIPKIVLDDDDTDDKKDKGSKGGKDKKTKKSTDAAEESLKQIEEVHKYEPLSLKNLDVQCFSLSGIRKNTKSLLLES